MSVSTNVLTAENIKVAIMFIAFAVIVTIGFCAKAKENMEEKEGGDKNG